MLKMMAVFVTLFFAGTLTILLPCILPLIPIVLGVSIAGKNRFRPLVTVAGMLITFVFFTFILQVLLSQFVTFADVIRISTYYILLLFGVCFLTQNRVAQLLVAVLGGFFFRDYGWIGVTIAVMLGAVAVEAGGRVASRIQQIGTDVQQAARSGLGSESLVTAFIVGLTLGLVWVPCAGPALGFALALVRDEPGVKALLALFAYGLGASLPLLLIGYGGQTAVHSARALSRYSGRIKQVAGALLILSAVGLHYGWLMTFQTFVTDYTGFGAFGERIEKGLFDTSPSTPSSAASIPSVTSMTLPNLPKIIRAPEFTGLGPWHNTQPFTLASLKGKVVLVDFWTYSCINCIRTLPYMEGYWSKFKGMPFVLVGVHTPEFVFEKSESNVEDAIRRHGLTYPVAQDNDFGTWNAFANRYWPAKYLIDAEGYIRYTHFGEGGYEETDLAIQSLLKEATGKTAAGPLIGEDAAAGGRREVSPETYVGARSWSAFSNQAGDPDPKVHSYTMPSSIPLHQYALSGDWQLAEDGEHQVLRSTEGEIRYHALAGEVNLVLGLEDGVKPVVIDVFIDGKKTTTITVVPHDLYNLFTGTYGEHDVTLKIHGKGVQAYAYTFGS